MRFDISASDILPLFRICDTGNKGYLDKRELLVALGGVIGYVPLLTQESEKTLFAEFLDLVEKHYGKSSLATEREQDLARRVFLSFDERGEGSVEISKILFRDTHVLHSHESGRLTYREFVDL